LLPRAQNHDRVAFTDWERRKPDTPFGRLPVLKVDGQTVAQSNAINRYVGKLVDLYPSDPWQAAMEAVEDILSEIIPTLFLPEEEKKTRRKALAEGPSHSISPGYNKGSKLTEAGTSLTTA
jgi:glutathione S-transferase